MQKNPITNRGKIKLICKKDENSHYFVFYKTKYRQLVKSAKTSFNKK